MKIAICGDVHWSQYSSILRKRGENYSLRLENLIKSINWFNELAVNNNCAEEYFLGDFFDKAELNAEELSALNQVSWSNLPTFFLAGNHEMMSVDHKYSSARLLDLISDKTVITKPEIIEHKDSNLEICMLPYQLEDIRKSINEYFPKTSKKRIILSHNDISGIQMGKFISQSGFTIEELEDNADLVVNGHLHNGDKISNKIINIGILSGMNFSEDASRYDHCAFILDTNTLKIEVFENPYAFNFYKIDYTQDITLNLKSLKNNSVITFKCYEEDVEAYKKRLNNLSNIIEYRIIIQPKIASKEELSIVQENLTIDHLNSFKSYITDNFEMSKELLEELAEILK